MYVHEDDEWRMAVRDMPETERNNTEIELRSAAGLNPYEGGDE
jgi:hypothetical protein